MAYRISRNLLIHQCRSVVFMLITALPVKLVVVLLGFKVVAYASSLTFHCSFKNQNLLFLGCKNAGRSCCIIRCLLVSIVINEVQIFKSGNVHCVAGESGVILTFEILGRFNQILSHKKMY